MREGDGTKDNRESGRTTGRAIYTLGQTDRQTDRHKAHIESHMESVVDSSFCEIKKKFVPTAKETCRTIFQLPAQQGTRQHAAQAATERSGECEMASGSNRRRSGRIGRRVEVYGGRGEIGGN